MAQPKASSSSIDELVLSLYSINAICLNGPYILKSGVSSPFYIDLRVIVSHPQVLRAVSDEMYTLVGDRSFDCICGVPYTALPIATLMSVTHSKPMLMRRKEVKSYGLKRSIEGTFQSGQTCLVVEDLITSGMSIFETIEPLEKECQLRVEDIVVLINREQGGRENVESRGKRLHAVVTITQVMDILYKHKKITEDTVKQVAEFVKQSQVPIQVPLTTTTTATTSTINTTTPSLYPRLSYSSRISHCQNSAARRLLQIITKKQTNLCLSADVTTTKELLALVEATGPYICMLKTHIDILSDYDASVLEKLKELSLKYEFLLFEDRKYADIGSTVVHQYGGGIYRVAEWSHVINAHVIAGEGIIKGLKTPIEERLKQGNQSNTTTITNDVRGLLLIGEMSSEGSLATGSYTQECVRMAEKNQDFVFGFICQHALSKLPGMIHLSPGVQLPAAQSSSSSASTERTGTDTLGQQYHSPEAIIGRQGSDVIIVGRAIVNASDPASEAQRYQRAAWHAYEESLRATETNK